MNSNIVAIVLLLAGLGVFWPSLSGLLSKLKGAVTSVAVPRGGDPGISRDAAVACLLTARDFAHAEGRHETCAILEGCLPGLVHDKEHAKA